MSEEEGEASKFVLLLAEFVYYWEQVEKGKIQISMTHLTGAKYILVNEGTENTTIFVILSLKLTLWVASGDEMEHKENL